MLNSYEPMHILRINNAAADSMANLGASLPRGLYKQDGNPPFLKYIP